MHANTDLDGKGSSVWRRIAITGSSIAVPLLFLAGVALTVPIADPREFDFDEGVNLIKALLLRRGFSLYSQVWSDQPPLFTVLLARWFAWFGESVTASRFLVLLFSALLLWSFFQAVRQSASWPAALAATVALVLSEEYVRLSVSVMIGLPALALAMLAIYLFVVAGDAEKPWLMAVSGLALALSLQIKLFTVIVALVLASYLALDIVLRLRRGQKLRLSITLAIAWSAALLAAFLGLGLLMSSFNLDQLLGTHLAGRTRAAFTIADNVQFIGRALVRHAPYLLLALVGGFLAVRRSLRQALLPAGWLLLSLVALLAEKPVQYHYVLLLTIPLAWLSAYGVDGCLAWFAGLRRASSPAVARLRRVGGVLLALALLALMVFQLRPLQPYLPKEVLGGIPYDSWVVSRLCPGGRDDQALVWSDRPYYAFLAGQPEPPDIAVVTGKRFASGKLDEAGILSVLQASRPRYVVLERFYRIYSPGFFAELNELYRPVANYRWGPEQEPAQFYAARAATTGSESAAEQALFGGWLELTWNPGALPAHLTAGNCLGLDDLQWARPADLPGQDLALSLRLVDSKGETRLQHDEPLGRDWNTLRDRTPLPGVMNPLVPDGTPPGAYSVELVVYDPATGQPLSREGAAPAEPLVLGQVTVDRPTAASTLQSVAADFGPLRLVEATTPATEVRPGDSIPVSLLWQAAMDYQPEQYVVVVQLLDQRGNLVAALEEEPLAGRYPTKSWQAGELVRDHHVLDVPAGLALGSYQLITGVYRASDRVRLSTAAGFLALSSRDHYSIRNVEVK
jgi:hypothetical protein